MKLRARVVRWDLSRLHFQTVRVPLEVLRMALPLGPAAARAMWPKHM